MYFFYPKIKLAFIDIGGIFKEEEKMGLEPGSLKFKK